MSWGSYKTCSLTKHRTTILSKISSNEGNLDLILTYNVGIHTQFLGREDFFFRKLVFFTCTVLSSRW